MNQRVISVYERQFGVKPAVISKAPGRLEILGNHTDYNEGTILSVAVDRAMTISLGAASGTECTLFDDVVGETRKFDVNTLEPKKHRDWANYVKGVILEFQKRGISVPAFNAVLAGTVPLSAGMSSSAALEMAFVLAIESFLGLKLGWLEEARIGQGAENNTIGAKTGLLDQVSSLRGKAGQLVWADFRSLEVSNVPIPAGTSFVVANCMVKHNLTNEYNERREACEAVAKALGVKALRDVTPEALEEAKAKLADTAYRRAKHVVGEIDRVACGSQALRDNDLETFGRLMFESHESSRVNFENSIRELDELVAIGHELPGRLGARLSGGGFGGITVHLVRADQAEAYRSALEKEYLARTGLQTQTMICQAADGAHAERI